MYEASDIVAIGAARELILGQKPWDPEIIDSETIEQRRERVMDIDEVD